jgi:hypothetical protein
LYPVFKEFGHLKVWEKGIFIAKHSSFAHANAGFVGFGG